MVEFHMLRQCLYIFYHETTMREQPYYNKSSDGTEFIHRNDSGSYDDQGGCLCTRHR